MKSLFPRNFSAIFAFLILVSAGILFPVYVSAETIRGAAAGQQETLLRDWDGDKVRDRAGEVLVRFKPGAAPDKVLSSFSLKGKQELKHLGITKLHLDPAQLEYLLQTLAKNPAVAFIQRNHVYKASFTPSDPKYSEQWSLHNSQAPEAWDRARGKGVRIAIIDSGIDTKHPDLAPNIDRKADGSVNGYNAFHNTANYPVRDPYYETDPLPRDLNGHGTHVAGIAAAPANGQGVTGVAPEATIIPVKVLDKNGLGDEAGIADGIRWAADNGADIINLSFGGPETGYVIRDAVSYARSKGVVIVAAAGNSGLGTVEYPAALNGVISVAASNRANGLAFFSSFGPGLDVTAPGAGIISTLPTYDTESANEGFPRNYGMMSGTSMASPFVSGLAALVLAQDPSLAPDRVEQVIKSGTVDIGPSGPDTFYGSGLANLSRSLGVPASPGPVYKGNDSNEVNDDPAGGTVIPVNKATTFSGSFDPESDADWFRLDAMPGDLLKISLSTGTNADGVIEIFGGNFAKPVLIADNGGAGFTEKTELTVPQAGTFYVRVYNYNGGMSGKNYTLKIEHTGKASPPPAPIPNPAPIPDPAPNPGPTPDPVPTPDPGPIPLEQKATVVTGSNIRSGPGTNNSVITVLYPGDVLTVYGNEGRWSRVRLSDSRRGYIATSLLRFLEETGTVTVYMANVRTGPSTSYNIMSVVRQADNLTVIGKSGTWYKVRLADGREGFIAGSLIEIRPAAGQDPGNNSYPKGTTTPYWANIRTGPGISYTIIKAVPMGTEVTVLATEGRWLRVRLADGTMGYIAASLVSLR